MFRATHTQSASRAPARRMRSAFTLIEIMAVVLIIGLLSTLVGVAVFRQVDRGRITAARAQISELEGVLELYRMDSGRFPTIDQGLEALVTKPSTPPEPRNYPAGGYMRGGRLPVDPWGMSFQYRIPGERNPHYVDLWSFGADGEPGGEDVDADIGNWRDDREG